MFRRTVRSNNQEVRMAVEKGAKTGDQIVLLSGGPVMTVQEESFDHRGVWAQWFSGKKLERGLFAYGSFREATDADRK